MLGAQIVGGEGGLFIFLSAVVWRFKTGDGLGDGSAAALR
jgi:hypothetical protein